jgi:hypothetical protein
MKARMFGNKASNASKYHVMVGNILRELFPTATILQEYSMANGKTTNPKASKLHVDYFIPMLNLAIEVDGEHHYEVVEYGKKDNEGFVRFEQRYKLDNIKNMIAEENGWTLVRIKYTFADDKEKIKQMIMEEIL